MEKQIEQIKNEVIKLKEQADKVSESANKVISVCNVVNASWSGSDLVGHADFFYGVFEEPPHNRRFSVEWGLINGVPGGWQERNGDEVLQKIEKDSGVSLEYLDKAADSIVDKFDELRKRVIIVFSSTSKDLAKEIEKFHLKTKVDILNKYWKRQIVTRDRGALFAGRKVPVHKYYESTALFLRGATIQLNEYLYLIDKLVAQSESIEQKTGNVTAGRNTYIGRFTLLRLTKIDNKDFDLSKLISLCKELDDNYSLENYHSCAMLLRAIVDHIPPIFDKINFDSVCAQHGSRSFKDIVKPLNETAKKIGHNYLHEQINKKVLVATETQVNFQANLDTLLNEAASILEKEK